MFAARGIGVVDLTDVGIAETDAEDTLEIYSTFEENALAKARYFFGLSGRATLADDSGLAVDALGGRPGVMSKRWSGRVDLSGQLLDDENNRLLLERLRETVPNDARDRGWRAHYVCVAAYVDASHALICRGEVHGRVVETPGGGGGFGYDPYFFSDELGCTFGEATREEKERVSHRARAFRALIDELASRGLI